MSQTRPEIRLDPATFFERPDVYPMEFDQGRLTLVPMTRETYHGSIFLDRSRIVPAAREGWQLALADLLGEFERRRPVQRPVRFIFHVAHCGSTLLSRALDVPGRALVLREPFALRQLGAEAAAVSASPGDPTRWQHCLMLVATLLGRRFADDERVMVKANVPVNFMLPALMDLHPDSRGLLLYCGFERYVLSVLKTPMHQRWVMNVTSQLAGGIRATPEMEDLALDKLSVAEAAACLWLAQMRRFQSLTTETPAVRGLDCDDFFAQPVEVLERIVSHLGLDIPSSEFETAKEGGLFTHHGKDTGRTYDRQTRERELDDLRQRLSSELTAAQTWLEAQDVDEAGLRPQTEV